MKTGTDNQAYLHNIIRFVNVSGEQSLPGSLAAASFWVGLRQEIYIAVMTARPVGIPLVQSLVDRSLSKADDHIWANRAIAHCADVLNFVYGDEAESNKRRWRQLSKWNEGWAKALPLHCKPYRCSDGAPGEAFPRIWYQQNCDGRWRRKVSSSDSFACMC
jgi:hypothetical protein